MDPDVQPGRDSRLCSEGRLRYRAPERPVYLPAVLGRAAHPGQRRSVPPGARGNVRSMDSRMLRKSCWKWGLGSVDFIIFLALFTVFISTSSEWGFIKSAPTLLMPSRIASL
ncbi:hypothetical protein D3C80_708760 [compost metagenome]